MVQLYLYCGYNYVHFMCVYLCVYIHLHTIHRDWKGLSKMYTVIEN